MKMLVNNVVKRGKYLNYLSLIGLFFFEVCYLLEEHRLLKNPIRTHKT